MVVILQSDFAAPFETCVVAPVVSEAQLPAIARLRPPIRVADQDCVVVIDRLAAVDRLTLGEVISSAEHLRDEITRGLDLLFTGF